MSKEARGGKTYLTREGGLRKTQRKREDSSRTLDDKLDEELSENARSNQRNVTLPGDWPGGRTLCLYKLGTSLFLISGPLT
jgi:hypothetical protein